MVAFLCLFEQSKILVEHRFLWERDTIYTRHHRSRSIATPISGCTRQHFHGFDRSGGRDMRTLTQVGEVALGVGGYMSVLQLRDKLTLICLTFLSEVGKSVCFAYVFAAEHLLALLYLLHLLLYTRQVRLFDGLTVSRENIVIETVLDSRTYTELNTGIQLLQCLSHEVRRGVPECMLGFLIVPLMKTKLTIGMQRQGQIHLLKIFGSRNFYTRCQHFLCKALTDRLSHLKSADAISVLALTSIRKSDSNHDFTNLQMFD